MATSVAINFCTKDELDFLRNDYSYDMEWHEAHRHIFQGYIDDTFGHFVLVDEEKRLYRESVYSYLDDKQGCQLKELDIEWIFKYCAISDSYYNNDAHKQKWIHKFKQADQELYLWLEYH